MIGTSGREESHLPEVRAVKQSCFSGSQDSFIIFYRPVFSFATMIYSTWNYTSDRLVIRTLLKKKSSTIPSLRG